MNLLRRRDVRGCLRPADAGTELAACSRLASHTQKGSPCSRRLPDSPYELPLLRKDTSAMPLYYIEYECNEHSEQSSNGVDLANFAEAAAYAVSAAPLFHDLIPGERRGCAFDVRDASEGWRLKIALEVCLDSPEPVNDDIDGGLLE